MNTTKKILDWKNIVLLSLISYGLYTMLWLVVDKDIWQDGSGRLFITELAVDFCMCVLFVCFSLFYSRIILRMQPIRNRHYGWLLFYAIVLFLLNNAMAYALTALCNAIWSDGSSELFRLQGIYTYGMIASFVSSIYYNAFYLENYMKTEDEKRRLEVALLKEQEVALQSQLDTLKAQIDTHFMVNNFSILAELIEEDRTLAGKFLANLSKVYRYIIQNLKRHKIAIGEEVAFLDAYLYLVEMRYGKAVVVRIDNEVRIADGSIPPACLQLLVENAIKHNRHSADRPLHIDIRREGDYLSVCNRVAPLLSQAEPSTGIGQRNIAERYSLLSDRQMIVSFTTHTYAVKLPILEN